MLIDAHCHLSHLSLNKQGQLFETAANKIICIDSSVDYPGTLDSLALSKKYPFIKTASGFHPFWAQTYSQDLLKKYDLLIEKNLDTIVAIGEVGLDFKAEVNLSRQEDIFRKFIELAKKYSLVLLIHSRIEAPATLFALLNEYYQDYSRIVFHCFSYGVETMKYIIEKYGYLSFSLNVLRNKKRITESLSGCGIDRLLLETDSPYMKIQGNDSSPLDIEKVYRYVADLKRIEYSTLIDQISKNANALFSWEVKQ